MDFLEKTKQLLCEIIFLTPFQRNSLIKSLPKFSKDELQQMYLAFSGLKKREGSLLEKFFAENPSARKDAEGLMSALSMEMEAGKAVQGKMQFMKQAEKLFKDFNK